MRPLALIAGGAILVAAGVAVALGVLGGSTSSTRKTVTGVPVSARLRGAATGTHSRAHAVVRQVAPKAPAVSPAETSVAVLNATEAEGLAHRTAAALQQSGYSQATALSGRPPGPGQVSVVEYTSGHQAEAEGVARSLSIAHVLPIEAGVSALAESANVVVILGEDRAGQTP